MKHVPCFDQYEVIKNIVGGAKDKALLLGVLGRHVDCEVYFDQCFVDFQVRIERRELKNRHSRLDIIYINSDIAGTILSSKLAPQLLHMVGMFVVEKYRFGRLVSHFPEYIEGIKEARGKVVSPAELLLGAYLDDVVNNYHMQVSLEVLNGNVAAWRLYEKPVLLGRDGFVRGFRLLTREEIEIYGARRGKTVGEWFDVETTSTLTRAGIAVRWKHIPHYGRSAMKWSVNRVYLITSVGDSLALSGGRGSILFDKFRTMATILRYGNVFGTVRYVLKKALSKHM